MIEPNDLAALEMHEDVPPMARPRSRTYTQGMVVLSRATSDVIDERQRQIDLEAYSSEHDDEHKSEEIAAMAAFYAMPSACREWPSPDKTYGFDLGSAIVPTGWFGKTGDRRRELVKAGALIIAEIDRLDRLAEKS